MKTYLGFPIREDGSGPGRERQSGIALLIAILVITSILTFTTDLIVTSRVSLESAVKNRDNVKAEYMAKSAINLGLFLLSADMGIDKVMQAQAKTEPTDTVGDIWTMLNGLPIGGKTIEMVASLQENFDLNAVNDGKVLEQLRDFDGEFVLDIQDESSKINVNFMYQRSNQTEALLQALMSCAVEKEFLSERNLDPKELTFKIKDYIDANDDANPNSGTNDEKSAYLAMNPPYEPKNGYLDTVDELRMIDGWDDDVHAVFSPYLTVYPYPSKAELNKETDNATINLNTATRELLGCLFPKSKDECQQQFEVGLKGRQADKTSLASTKKDLASILGSMFCDGGKDKQKWFDISSKAFSISAIGEVGDQRREIKAVVQRQEPDPKNNLTRSYQFLYWRLL